MFNKGIFTLLAACAAVAILPAPALAAESAQEQSAMPVLGLSEVMHDGASEAFTQQFSLAHDTGAYPANAQVLVYASESGEDVPSGVSYNVTTRGTARGRYINRLSITVPPPREGGDTYYIAVREENKAESRRAPFTVLPYSGERRLLELLRADGAGFECGEAEAGDQAQAAAALAGLLNERIRSYGLDLSLAAEDLAVTGFAPARFGNNGGLSAVLNVGGEPLELKLIITASSYGGGLYYALEGEQQVLHDSGGPLGLEVYATVDAALLNLTPEREDFKLSLSGAELVEAAGAAIAEYSYAPSPEGLVSLGVICDWRNWQPGGTLYLWYSGAGVNQCIGSVRVFTQRTPAPELLCCRYAYGGALVLANPTELQGAKYAVYRQEDGKYVKAEGLYVEQLSLDAVRICARGGDAVTGNVAVSAIKEGMYESELRELAIYGAGQGPKLTLAQALPQDSGAPESEPAEVIVYGEVEESGGAPRLDIARLQGGAAYAQMQRHFAGDGILGAYEISIDDGNIAEGGKLAVRLFAGTAHSGKELIAAHIREDGATDIVKGLPVDENGFVYMSVDSLSPFMVGLAGVQEDDGKADDAGEPADAQGQAAPGGSEALDAAPENPEGQGAAPDGSEAQSTAPGEPEGQALTEYPPVQTIPAEGVRQQDAPAAQGSGGHEDSPAVTYPAQDMGAFLSEGSAAMLVSASPATGYQWQVNYGGGTAYSPVFTVLEGELALPKTGGASALPGALLLLAAAISKKSHKNEVGLR